MNIGTLKKINETFDGSVNQAMGVVNTLPWIIRTIDNLCDTLAKTIAERDKLQSDYDSLKSFYKAFEGLGRKDGAK